MRGLAAADMTWTRLTFVFGSVEAIAFAAAGALFGVSVQREGVKKVEERADANAHEAACSRALAAVNLADKAAADQDLVNQSFGSRGLPDAALRRRHGEVARHLFPDL
jgi:hypothetical protein